MRLYYCGQSTDWIGFEFEYDDREYVVTHKTNERNYAASAVGRDYSIHLTERDLMHQYILQLESMVENYEQSAMERGEYD